MPSSLPCVYYAATVGEADIVAAWLEERGIQTFVKDRFAAGTLQTPMIIAPEGIAVCVLDPDAATSARDLLATHFADRAKSKAASPPGRAIDAECEECGRMSRFSDDQRGRVQNCPHCGEYMDVPS